jgi:2-dehydro-3-deoxygluconokinase
VTDNPGLSEDDARAGLPSEGAGVARRTPVGEPTGLPTRPEPDAIEVVTLGECLVSFVARDQGPLSDVADFRRHVAGAEANVAVGLARLGHRSAFIGRVGDDSFGTTIVRGLRGNGVDVSWLRVEPDARTGLMFRERRGAGPSEVVYHRAGSAGSRLGPEDVYAADTDGLFAGARVLHITGITPALSPTCRDAVLEAIERAKANDLAIALDINLRRRLWSDAEATDVIRPLLASVDVVFGSLEEGIVVGGTSEDAGPRIVAAALIGSGAGHAVLKLGPDGAASLASDGTWTVVPAVSGVTVVDPVGAGDAFCAGYLAGQLEGLDEADALALGNACGAAVVAAEGDQAGAPTREEARRIGRLGADQAIR